MDTVDGYGDGHDLTQKRRYSRESVFSKATAEFRQKKRCVRQNSSHFCRFVSKKLDKGEFVSDKLQLVADIASHRLAGMMQPSMSSYTLYMLSGVSVNGPN